MLIVFFCVTLPAQKLEVLEAQRDLWAMNVLRRQLLDMMHDHTGTIDATPQTLLA